MPNGAGDVLLGSFAYQTEALGAFYHAQTNLANVGSRLASAAGLHHHTTSPSQVKEANSIVDLGFHYVALDAADQPVDSDGDGAVDTREDCDEDGSLGSGETDWQSGSDPGFKIIVLRPTASFNLP